VDLEGKVALITGGGTGLGRIIARHLASVGMHIAVGYSRSQIDALAMAEMRKLIASSVKKWKSGIQVISSPTKLGPRAHAKRRVTSITPFVACKV
jgi:NAD(P)-dependent dehydrogenase (short-subunit alcohol dehydrogenase family)